MRGSKPCSIMRKQKNKFAPVIFLWSLIFLTACGSSTAPPDVQKIPATQHVPIQIVQRQTSQGNRYTFIYQHEARADFVLKRPDEKDTSIFLCIPAAFTRLDNGSVSGIAMSNGKTSNRKGVTHAVGGALSIVNGRCKIFGTQKGKLLTEKFLDSLEALKGSLFQQIQLVSDRSIPSFKDKEAVQRRAIVQCSTGYGIVESTGIATLETFAKDLQELGVINALYTDMGSFDEGWFRDPAKGDLKKMGWMSFETDKQSNWFVFRR